VVNRRPFFAFVSSAPIGVGAYAEVFKARRKSDDRILAFKQLTSRTEHAVSRMKREIKAQGRLAHPNIMPIWDVDPDNLWFTMPLAEGNLEDLRPGLDEEDLAKILSSIADGLSVAHERGEIHRDVKPENILALEDSGADSGRRWVIADWGHVRLAPSDSVSPLTRHDTPLGTDGYAAPELLDDAHNATPASDIYSLGRVAAWFLARQRPRGERPLYPPREMQHWRGLVRVCTEPEPQRRIANIAQFRRVLEDVFRQPLMAPALRAMELTERLLMDDNQALLDLVSLAEDNPDDSDLYLDGVAQIPGELMRNPVAEDPNSWCRIGTTMTRFILESAWGDRDASYVATPLGFIYRLLCILASIRAFEELEDLARYFFAAEVQWHSETQRIKTLEWLSQLDEDVGVVVARSLRAVHGAVAYYRIDGLPATSSPTLGLVLRSEEPGLKS
jgi:serine/threonine protein kinase